MRSGMMPHGQYGREHWMRGGGYGMGPQMMGNLMTVPGNLPAPKNTEWIEKLREVLLLEEKSYAQYTADAEKYNAAMPYMMVIPQEEEHINLIEEMFEAYGINSGANHQAAVETKNLQEALQLCARMEEELIPRYEWLVQHAGDLDSAKILSGILLQTRWHLAMFQHALGLRGHGMGPGMMMGRGGYGMGHRWRGRGYLRPSKPDSQQIQKPLDEKSAKGVFEEYLKTTGNPNLRLGKITEQGKYFEAEIVTKEGSLVDKVLVDRETGWMHSVY